jgi:pyruvate/2-oxoglutarate dehydrogenase complex dihydrolipoamide dehydrogenase (E3) component
MAVETYDAVILGAGQAGTPLAVALARAGRRTALVERAHVGGTCVNEGCTPTKTLVASAAVASWARRAANYGIQTGPVSVDMVRVRQRKRDIVDLFRTGGEGRLRDAGAVLVRGEARFTGPRTVSVSGEENRELTAPQFFLNTGCQPSRPPIPGLDTVPNLNSTTILELDVVPEHLVVLGGGYVAVEFGQMFRRFGARVTLIERGAQLLGREDPDLARALADILAEDGLTLRLQSRAVSVARGPGAAITVEVGGPDGSTERITGSHLLVGVGRSPNTEALDLPAAGVQVDGRGFIRVDDQLRTSAPGIFALGDVTGGPAFTHVSYDDFRIVRDNLLHGENRSTAGRLLAFTLFTDPQLGRVGLTETEARRVNPDVRVATLPMTSVARALETDQSRGFLKAVVDGRTWRILGFAALGMEGGELTSVVQAAMLGGLGCRDVRDAVFPHPGLAESLNNLFSLFEA